MMWFVIGMGAGLAAATDELPGRTPDPFVDYVLGPLLGIGALVFFLAFLGTQAWCWWQDRKERKDD